ncbi:hypothetical protein TSUD_30100 [Trifolium subterraneum]|uniref:Reverse transcriptase domain-containing protein n=1 Tax=Trifolium subterraneum TaxID=3900 RepID=A0A2Z6MR00_TRISU|nr:hypothetical protein TSUD_30100 [Trifolium subterraneum]
MNGFSIPWGCLDGGKEQEPQPQNQPKNHKTFAQTLKNVCDIPTSQLPQPCVKGDDLAISIPEEEYLVGIDTCKHNLQGRVVWPRGSTPLTVVELKNKLSPMWKDLARWGITSLGKGFYQFSFSTLEDVKRVRSVASWNLQPGFLKLFAWSPDFNPNLQKNTTAQVWVRLYGLAQEYWHPKILFAIASSIGTPICTDAIAAKPMFDRTFGHYARVLVDLDLSQTLRYKVLVERIGFAFYVETDYENLPPFCTHCNLVGHYLNNCKWVQGFDEGNQSKEPRHKNEAKAKYNEAKAKYVQKKDGKTEQNKTNEVVVVEDSIDKTPQCQSNINAPKEPVASVDRQVPLHFDVEASNNRFSALDTQDEVIQDIENEAGLEELVEVDDVESSTQEFVGDTQFNKAAEIGEAHSSSQNNAQDKVQIDMQFLKESWANMVENDDDEFRLLEDLEKQPSPSGFTVVNSKSRKKGKSKASKNTMAASSYGTRSKDNMNIEVVMCLLVCRYLIFKIALIPMIFCTCQLEEAEDSLAEIQTQIQLNGYSDILSDSEKRAQSKLDDALKKQHWFWHEKSKEGAPGPDGCIMPNFNANTLILIPKTSSADAIEHYRPIAMANFKFKLISKVLADRLAQIMPNLISKEQRGLIHGRNIKDCLCLASEAANLLHSKTFGGNLALKIDVTKAFDTLEWPFLLKVLRNITKLVTDGKLLLSKGSRNVSIPSHCLYADDIMVYCNGRHSNLVALKNLFNRYALASGQVVSPSKSTIFSGGISHARLLQIAQFIGFNIGSLPFNYLGVPIFKGRPRVAFLQPVADKIKAKLAAWKASLLSIAGRVQLVKSVIQSMLVYTISIYAWPISLLRELERWIKNFIWSGDINQRKLFTVAWKKVCKPYSQGGLGLRSLIILNEASNLKLCWDLFNSREQWAIILRSKTFRSRRCINHHIHSSLWSSVKAEYNVVLENSHFIIGDGSTIYFWSDIWCGDHSLAQSLQFPDGHMLEAKVSDFIQNHQWHLTPEIEGSFPNLRQIVEKVTIPLEHKPDALAWRDSDFGDLSLKQTYLFKDHLQPQLHWAKSIWSNDIPPSKSLVAWRLMHDGAFNSVTASCGGVFRNHHADFVVAFAEKVDFQSSFIAELCGVMTAIELANAHNWLNLWIETDSSLAVMAFKSNSMVPWTIGLRI